MTNAGRSRLNWVARPVAPPVSNNPARSDSSFRREVDTPTLLFVLIQRCKKSAVVVVRARGVAGCFAVFFNELSLIGIFIPHWSYLGSLGFGRGRDRRIRTVARSHLFQPLLSLEKPQCKARDSRCDKGSLRSGTVESPGQALPVSVRHRHRTILAAPL